MWTATEFRQKTGLQAERAWLPHVSIPFKKRFGRGKSRASCFFFVSPRQVRTNGVASSRRGDRPRCSVHLQVGAGKEPCKNWAHLGGLCTLCLHHLGVVIQESPGCGRGLFAKRDLPAGPLCALRGRLVQEEEEDRRFFRGNLFWDAEGHLRVALSEQACVARFANTASANTRASAKTGASRKGKKKKNNARFVHLPPGEEEEGVWLVLCRPVEAGEEVLVDYWGGE